MPEGKRFEFFLVRYVPDLVRGEFINIGIIVHDLDSAEGNAVMSITRNWARVLSVDPGADTEMLEALEEDVNSQFAEGNESITTLLSIFQSQLSNSLQITEPSVSIGASLAAEAARLMT